MYRILILCVTMTALGACAAKRYDRPPAINHGSLFARVVPYAPDFEDLHLGTHRVPNSSFAVNKYQQHGKAEVAMSAIGILTEEASGREDSKAIASRIKPALRIDLASEVRKIYQELSAQETLPALMARVGVGKPLLELEPWVLISTVDGKNARLYCYLKVMHIDDKNRRQRWRRYIYYVPGEFSLNGPDAIVTTGGDSFRSSIHQAYEKMLILFRQDLDHKQKTWENRKRHIQLRVPGDELSEAMKVMVLRQTEEAVIFIPKVARKSAIDGINWAPLEDIEWVQGESP